MNPRELRFEGGVADPTFHPGDNWPAIQAALISIVAQAARREHWPHDVVAETCQTVAEMFLSTGDWLHVVPRAVSRRLARVLYRHLEHDAAGWRSGSLAVTDEQLGELAAFLAGCRDGFTCRARDPLWLY